MHCTVFQPFSYSHDACLLLAAQMSVRMQGMLVTEHWVDRIARLLDQAPEHIREINFLKEGETTHFGQVMECSQVLEAVQSHKASRLFSLPPPTVVLQGLRPLFPPYIF